MVEPISPELVLVDPELARARPERNAVPHYLVVRTGSGPASAAPRDVERLRSGSQTMLTALLLASLALNGALLARAVIHRDGPAAKSVATAAAESRAHVTPAAVQQRLLSILVQRPNGRLPRSLIDPATGLARGNLEATCSGPGPAFDCVVRPASHASGEGLRVRYLPDGTFVWGSYAAKR